MRLIDADKLKEYHCRKMCDDIPCIFPCVEVEWIDNQPTAYDIDKVVEQLEEDSWSVGCSFAPKENRTTIIKTEKAIEIVKGGAV